MTFEDFQRSELFHNADNIEILSAYTGKEVADATIEELTNMEVMLVSVRHNSVTVIVGQKVR